MKLADKVRIRRNELNLSQEELAKRMGYSSRTSINKIENGRPCSQKIIARLAEALDVSIAYLMGWEDEIQKNPVEAVERHFEILMDEDFVGLFEDFKKLNAKERKVVKELIHNMAYTEG